MIDIEIRECNNSRIIFVSDVPYSAIKTKTQALSGRFLNCRDCKTEVTVRKRVSLSS